MQAKNFTLTPFFFNFFDQQFTRVRSLRRSISPFWMIGTTKFSSTSNGHALNGAEFPNSSFIRFFRNYFSTFFSFISIFFSNHSRFKSSRTRPATTMSLIANMTIRSFKQLFAMGTFKNCMAPRINFTHRYLNG